MQSKGAKLEVEMVVDSSEARFVVPPSALQEGDSIGEKNATIPTPFGIAFSTPRGYCQLCDCRVYVDNEGCCQCSHFPAHHKNLGTVNSHTSLLPDPKKVLIPIYNDSEWPKILNPYTEVLNELVEFKEWVQEENIHWIASSSELQFLSLIGEGTSAKVYKGLYKHTEDSTTSGVEVAIKLLDFEALSKNQKNLQNFFQELKIMIHLKTPSIVSLYGVVIEPRVCLVLEYCAKGSLYHLLKKEEFRMDWELFFSWGLEILQGVCILHSQNPQIVHRDIKTLNLLIDENDHVKITDFGLARFLTKEENLSTLTRLRGTYCYTAPEIYYAQKYTTASDIFSLSVVLWEMACKTLTGNYIAPYSDLTISFDFQIIIAVAKRGARPSIPKGVPAALKDMIEKLWNSIPEERPTIQSLIEMMRSIQKDYETNKFAWVMGCAVTVDESPSGLSSENSNPNSANSSPSASPRKRSNIPSRRSVGEKSRSDSARHSNSVPVVNTPTLIVPLTSNSSPSKTKVVPPPPKNTKKVLITGNEKKRSSMPLRPKSHSIDFDLRKSNDLEGIPKQQAKKDEDDPLEKDGKDKGPAKDNTEE